MRQVLHPWKYHICDDELDENEHAAVPQLQQIGKTKLNKIQKIGKTKLHTDGCETQPIRKKHFEKNLPSKEQLVDVDREIDASLRSSSCVGVTKVCPNKK